MALFQQSVLDKYIKNLDAAAVQQAWQVFTSYFHNPAIQQNIRDSKEEEFQEGFLRELFVNVLGYTLKPHANFNLTTEYRNIKDTKKADGAILINNEPVGVIELKGTNTTDLTKVETQAFGYKNNHPKVTYIVIANFEKLNFYIDTTLDPLAFNLFTLSLEEFKLLYLCLAYSHIASGLPKRIKDESLTQEDKITKQLYKDYAAFKSALFDNIRRNNPQFDALVLYKSTQKLLDRLLFLFFAEDRQLLPPNFIRQIITDSETVKKLGIDESLYQRFKINFQFLNTGHKAAGHDIFAYNGGLFYPDDVLDTIVIDDDILSTHALKLANYNYQTEVDVNILGHIFENSLNELDEVKATLEGREVDKGKTKRKKDGVFYTPKYITKYIVDNTVGRLCAEKKAELGIVEEEYTADKKRIAKTKKALDDKLESYRQWLLQITIVDPACGSGAFLNQALDFLITEHRYIDELRAKLLGYSLVLTDVENSILENNLFGVDINEESVDIAKLSLWLRTAQPRRKLNNLNNNIKCGNSLIDDPAVAGEKAFNWHTEFADVFARGGFDVVIGNPPYVQIYENHEFYTKQYLTSKSGDLYALFYEKGIELLKQKGRFAFITPSLFIKGVRYESLREYLLNNSFIYEIQDMGDGVFEDVQMPTAIVILQKIKGANQIWNSFIEGSSLIDKVEANSTNLSLISSIRRGIEIGKDKVESSIINGVRIITGEDISRYIIKNYQFIENYIYEEFKKDEKYFIGERIVIRETGSRITSIYVNENVQQNRSLYSIILNNDSISYKYILSLINSSLLQFYYKSKFAANTDVFPKIRISQVKDLPIKISDNQQPFIAKADEMLRLNKELQEASGKFTRNLMREFSLATLPGKLQNWHTLTYAEFLKELTKLKVTLSLAQKAEWEDYFTKEQTAAQALAKQIESTDKAIDQMVYALYELTDEEIKIVEGN